MGLRLDPNLLFRHPTISELAAKVDAPDGGGKTCDGPRPAPFSLVDDDARAKVLEQLRNTGGQKDT